MADLRVEMQAIAMDATNHVNFANRSAAYIRLQKFTEALADADKAISLNAGYSKAYNCRGAALEGLGTFVAGCFGVCVLVGTPHTLAHTYTQNFTFICGIHWIDWLAAGVLHCLARVHPSLYFVRARHASQPE